MIWTRTHDHGRAWQVASDLVCSRPWLDISWIEPPDGDQPGHLAVHDGPNGAALHFDGESGPTWEPRSAPVRELEWDDVTEGGSARLLGAADWLECWGPPAHGRQITEKSAIYVLIAHLLNGPDDGHVWSVRPAKLLEEGEQNGDQTSSAFDLIDDFPTLAGAVRWYLDQIASASWGEGAVWHEPLWQVCRDDKPRLVLDEAGRVHLTFESLVEAIQLLATAADLGGIDDPHTFELLDAVPRAGGSFTQLASSLRHGPAETLRTVKPDNSTIDPALGT